jgi:hypothetical protein
MATFTLNWDNTLVLAEPNAINQRASYRKKLDVPWITAGFSPANDLATTDVTASVDLLTNTIYEFKVEALCTSGGPTENDNGIIEQLVFECVSGSIFKTSTTVTPVLDLTATDITKVRFILRLQGDGSLVQSQTVNTPGTIGTTSCEFTGLTPNTAYYITAEFYCIINGVEVISSSVDYLNAVCGGNVAGWQVTTDALPVANIIFSWNRLITEQVNLTLNINGSFDSIDWGDGTINTSLVHTYASTANFTVRIYGSTATTIELADGIDAITYNITAFTTIPATVTYLDLNNNLLTVIPSLTANTSLTYLDLSHNNIVAFPDISSNILLEELYLNDNSIVGSYDFTLNTALTSIDLSINSITGVSGFDGPTSLNSLNLGSNNISVSDINAALIDLDANGVTNGTFYSLPQAPVAPPSGTGATAKANLIVKGWTVSTD